MVRMCTLLCVVLAITCAAAAMAADWPNLLGPTRNSLSPETGLNKDWGTKPPAMLWKVALSDGGYSGPSCAENKVFIIDHQGATDIVRAFDVNSGKEVWSYSYPDADKSNYGFSRATPTYAAGKLYTLSRLGTLNCLSSTDGKLLWSRNILADFAGQKPGWDYSGSVLIDGDRAIVDTGGKNGNVACLDKDTGATIWAGGNGDVAGYCTPVVATILGVKQYIVTGGTSVVSVAADTGKLLWTVPWKNKCLVNASQPIVEDNYVFITSGYNIGCATYEITAQGAVQRWANGDISAHFSSPVFYNGFIYSDSDPGNLVCMNPQDGSVIWTQPGFEKGGLIIADGTIIMFDGKNGNLVMAAAVPDGYKELGRIQPLGGQSWTAPILCNGKLIIRNTTTLACLDLK